MSEIRFKKVQLKHFLKCFISCPHKYPAEKWPPFESFPLSPERLLSVLKQSTGDFCLAIGISERKLTVLFKILIDKICWITFLLFFLTNMKKRSFWCPKISKISKFCWFIKNWACYICHTDSVHLLLYQCHFHRLSESFFMKNPFLSPSEIFNMS